MQNKETSSAAKIVNMTFTVYDDDSYLHLRFWLPTVAAIADWQKQYPHQELILKTYIENTLDLMGIIFVVNDHPHYESIKRGAIQAAQIVTKTLEPDAIKTLGWRQVEDRHYVMRFADLPTNKQ